MTQISAGERDRADTLASCRDKFILPDGVIYLDGNSLGPVSHTAISRINHAVTHEWAAGLVRSWNSAGWMDLPITLGNRLAPLIGAPADTVIVTDTLTILIAKLLANALALRPDRHVIVTDSDNFHSDFYIADGVAAATRRDITVRRTTRAALAEALDDDVAVVLLTHVDYRTGELLDMADMSALVHAHGALMIWDLAHSTGAVPLHVYEHGADFAAGCGYKYLNGGPGAPAFAYVAPQWLDSLTNFLPGWLGHARPFDFEATFEKAPGIRALVTSSPSVVGLSALAGALDVFEGISLDVLRRKSLALTDFFITEVEERLPGVFELVTPREHHRRASQVSWRHDEAYGIVQALIARGVIGDFRAPNIARFGFTPLYLSFRDVDVAVSHLVEVMHHREYDDPAFRQKNPVT